ncbi:MAG: glutamate-cysteine ligase family protein, partial [Solirubrobacteraceae bacterium]
MVQAGVIEDYTYLWHDVRPHPKFGTVEIRVMDSQTHIEHSLGLVALVQAMVRELAEHYDAGQQLSKYPF